MSAISEIPLIVPEHLSQSKRFVITNELTIESSLKKKNTKKEYDDDHLRLDYWDGPEEEWERQMQGSVATLTHIHGPNTTILRSVALPEEPRVLSLVRMDPYGDIKEGVTSVELDLSHVSLDQFGMLTKTMLFHGLFYEEEEDEEVEEEDWMMQDTIHYVYHMVLVDARANVLRLQLDTKTLDPIHSKVHHVSTYNVLSSYTNRYNRNNRKIQLSSEQIAALDPHRIIFAMSPDILCLHMTSNHSTKIVPWTKESCIDNRRPSLGGILKTAGGMLLGKTAEDIQEEEDFIPEGNGGSGYRPNGPMQGNVMPSTASLFVMDITRSLHDQKEEEKENDVYVEGNDSSMCGKVLCSLHSDGSVWLWVSMSKSAYPKQVNVMIGANGMYSQNVLPSPHLWSSASDSLDLCGCAQVESDGRIRVALGIGITLTPNMSTMVHRTSSPCHIFTLEGYLTDSGKILPESVEFLERILPKETCSIKGLATQFSKESSSWTLKTLLSTNLSDETSQSVTSRSLYSHFTDLPMTSTSLSVYSQKSTMPTVLEQTDTLDVTIKEKYDAFTAQCKMFLEKEAHSDDDLSLVLHRFDTLIMKSIFRSSQPQSVGLTHPSEGTIRRALRQVISPICFTSLSNESAKASIEIETLSLMKSWVQHDDSNYSSKRRRISSDALVSTQETGSSVYQNFNDANKVSYDYDNERASTPDMDSDDGNLDSSPITYEKVLLDHYNRWDRLIYALHHEEYKLLLPLQFICLPRSNECFIVRAAVSSILPTIESTGEPSLECEFMKCFHKLEATSQNSALILDFLAKTDDIISKASLVFGDGKESFLNAVDELSSNLLVKEDVISSQLVHMLQSMSDSDRRSFLSSPFPSFFGCHERSGTLEPMNGIDLSPSVYCAARLARKLLNSSKRVALARFIIISICNTGGEEDIQLAKLVFLNTVAVCWASAQMISKRTETGTKDIHSHIPLARISGVLSSQLGTTNAHKTPNQESVLMSCLLKMSKDITLSGTTLLESIILLSESYVRLVIASPETEQKFPTLALLPNELKLQHRLCLRLVAPYVALPNRCSEDLELASDCLLTEIEGLCRAKLLSGERVYEMQMNAYKMLEKPYNTTPNPTFLSAFFQLLQDISAGQNSTEVLPDHIYEPIVYDFVQDVFKKSSMSIYKEDMVRLCKSVSFRKLFDPCVKAARNHQMSILELLQSGTEEQNFEAILVHGAGVLLMLSSLTHRVAVLEKQESIIECSSFSTPFSLVLFHAVNDVILFIQEHAHSEDFMFFEEYAGLWSSLFRHSLNGERWSDSFRACLSNPIQSRRLQNFKRMVLAIVDKGKLGMLLDELIFGVAEGVQDDSIDVYELASQTLQEAAEQHARNEVHDFSNSTSCTTDYRACLYSLHAGYENWKASCESMDFYGALALQNFNRDKDHDDIDMIESEDGGDLDSLAMNELLLSTTASSQLIQVVSPQSDRYVVHGELYPTVFVLGITENYHSKSDDNSRASRLFSENSLHIRAKKMIALYTLFNDIFCSSSLEEILQASDTQIIDALSRLGYYNEAIALARCKNADRKGAKPGGVDLFSDALIYMLCECLAPTAVNLSRLPLTANDIPESAETSDDFFRTRPTMNQLRLILGDGRKILGGSSWSNMKYYSDIDRGDAAMNLLRLYTCQYSSPENDISLRVADKLLDLDSAQSDLPLWLRNLLIGNDRKTGLFAKKSGDPTALLNLYMKYGLLVDACHLVSEVLTDHSRIKSSTVRLPENGDIDFVPYETIDRLWNLMNAYVNLPSTGVVEKQLVDDARIVLEAALKKHFELMRISETGMLSARKLKS